MSHSDSYTRRFCARPAEAKHSLDLLQDTRTSDADIIDIAEHENWTVVTKDDNFVQSVLVNGRLSRLLLVSTGNISNTELKKMIETNLKTIVETFEESRSVEVGRDWLVIHE